MADFKRLVLVKFKEGVSVEELMERLQKIVTEIDGVKAFEWGQDVGNQEMLSHGFTHVFILTFKTAEDSATYDNHPSHVEYSQIFGAAIEKVLLFHFPPVYVKPAAA